MNDSPQYPDPPRKRKMHPALIILLVVRLLLIITLAALTFPLIAYGFFILAFLLIGLTDGFD